MGRRCCYSCVKARGAALEIGAARATAGAGTRKKGGGGRAAARRGGREEGGRARRAAHGRRRVGRRAAGRTARPAQPPPPGVNAQATDVSSTRQAPAEPPWVAWFARSRGPSCQNGGRVPREHRHGAANRALRRCHVARDAATCDARVIVMVRRGGGPRQLVSIRLRRAGRQHQAGVAVGCRARRSAVRRLLPWRARFFLFGAPADNARSPVPLPPRSRAREALDALQKWSCAVGRPR
jgi:hypothetical protein